jgi:predicted nucleotidyltransferase
MRAQEFVAEGKQPGKPVVDAIQKILPVAQEIWFHGSRATGRHRRNSDTDILVVVPNDLVGDQYFGAVRILQKLSSHFDNYDIQPTKSGTNIHQIAQEEGRLLWSSKQGVAEGKDFDQCFDKACKLYDKAVDKKLKPKLVQVADFKGNGTDADQRWTKLPQHVWQHYVVIVGDQVLDPTARQFGPDMPTQYHVSDLDRLWGQQYKIRPREGVAESNDKEQAVRRIQKMLNDRFNANLDVDGILGPLTQKSINRFMPGAKPGSADDPNRTTAVQGKKLKTNKVDEEQLDELSFLGSQCTKDCSGHRAGYEWSKRKGLRQANSWSPSFNKGAGLAVAGK